ncbi:Serine carboxypeptidase 3 [Vermiconidia calcicola]|uniref:Serine carboxypeptidase 3 n=1 Tax=Vermiconidia calcicola TaxID=1690605 RepID=A0ACC3MQK1_9PEZI|nr:Serine carboxypeptidase 3 [Vermiconidia calcicola]
MAPANMAATTICTSCLRALRHQARKELQSTSRQQYQRQSISSIARIPFGNTRAFATSPIQAAKSSPAAKDDPDPEPLIKLPPEYQRKTTTTSSSSTPTDPLKSFAASVRQSETLRSTTEPYVAYGSTEDLFRICSQQCSYTIPNALKTPPEPAPKNAALEDVGEGEGWWYAPKSQGGLALDVTFNTWAQVMFLHMYMLTVRLRMFPAKHARVWHQQLLDHFFYAAEDRMATWHGMAARGVRNRYLKDLLLQYRGVLFSYDEGLIKGDAVLAAAVWRNVFKADEGADLGDVGLVVAYLRRELQSLGKLEDAKIADAKVQFGDPGTLKKLVETKSPWLGRKFTPEELKGSAEGKSSG